VVAKIRKNNALDPPASYFPRGVAEEQLAPVDGRFVWFGFERLMKAQ